MRASWFLLLMMQCLLFKVGFSKAMSAGWITIDKSGGQPLVKRKVKTIQDVVGDHLKAIKEGKGQQVSEKDKAE